jgi:hypothetical protein
VRLACSSPNPRRFRHITHDGGQQRAQQRPKSVWGASIPRDGGKPEQVFPHILSLLFHNLLERLNEKYQLLRSHLPTRKTFFDDLRALTRYLYFESWEHLLTIEGLELEILPNAS